MCSSYSEYTREIIDTLLKHFNCSINHYDYSEDYRYESIVIKMTDCNYSMMINLKDGYDKMMFRYCGTISYIDVAQISMKIIYNVEQGYLNLIRRKQLLTD